MKKTAKFWAITIISAMQLSACNTLGNKNLNINNDNAKLQTAIEKAALSASIKSSNNPTLISLEKKYKRNSTNPEIALKYAKALRKTNYLEMASMILSPFANSDKTYNGINTEMSAIKLALGDYDSAEIYANKAIKENPKDHEAYQNLAIALDAKERHAEAEKAFRKSLENWQGDPTTIMNNLALNLATQGFIDEAIEILERAKSLSPDRIELERNLRIIRTLNER